jgi:hypothetical protein
MQSTDGAANRKWQVIEKYPSALQCTQDARGVWLVACGYTRAFVKRQEFFWADDVGPGAAGGGVGGGGGTGPDLAPPTDVVGLTARSTTSGIRLRWRPSAASDFAGVLVIRQNAAASSSAANPFPTVVTVYRGAARTVLDRAIQPGARYLYRVIAVDRGGNRAGGRSAGIRALRVWPLQGISITTRHPTFYWPSRRFAVGYQIQIWTKSRVVAKVRTAQTTYRVRRALRRGQAYRWRVRPIMRARKGGIRLGRRIVSPSFFVARRAR